MSPAQRKVNTIWGIRGNWSTREPFVGGEHQHCSGGERHWSHIGYQNYNEVLVQDSVPVCGCGARHMRMSRWTQFRKRQSINRMHRSGYVTAKNDLFDTTRFLVVPETERFASQGRITNGYHLQCMIADAHKKNRRTQQVASNILRGASFDETCNIAFKVHCRTTYNYRFSEGPPFSPFQTLT